MSEKATPPRREGSLEAPTRHPIPWRTAEYYDETALFAELERVYDICHGCRRCFSLCQSFPVLFDAIDATDDGELHGVPKKAYWDVVDQCYLCDLCYQTKCPYVPPHEWNLDFPHLMLRAKALRFKKDGASLRDQFLSSAATVGRLAGIPVVADVINAANRNATVRKVMESTLGIHRDARLPEFHAKSFHDVEHQRAKPNLAVVEAEGTTGRVALYATCYCNEHEPQIDHDLVAVFEHNGIPVTTVPKERCCGMPKLELGDLESVAKLKEHNIPLLASLVDQGFDLVAPVPSCVLMYKQELPLLFPDDPAVAKVKAAMHDPFEYLWKRHQAGLLKTDFQTSLGKVAYQVPCHLRVQNIGLKTRDVLKLVPETTFDVIERCTGHDGTYAVKKEFRANAMKIGKPVSNKVASSGAVVHSSDCPMAGHQISDGLKEKKAPVHPMTLLARAYGLATEKVE
jgi:Fe-S oxidoreductase